MTIQSSFSREVGSKVRKSSRVKEKKIKESEYA